MTAVRAALLAMLVWAAVPAAVSAHGREPMVGAIAFDPTDRDHILLRATWSFLESHDGGATWLFRCANAVGYDRTTEDPAIVITESGEIVAGTFDGVVRGDGCAFELSDDVDARGNYTIDVDRDPADSRTIWAIQSPGAIANTVIRSTDEGASWEVVGTPRTGEPILLLERLALAPSDPMRVYASGAVPATATSPTRRAFFLRSEDGGRTFVEREIVLEGEERNVHVLAVDPTDADRVFVRVTRRVTDTVPERLLLSEDGGETWMTAASLLEITGFVMSADGQYAWVGGWDGAFLRSDARGAVGSFVPVSTAPDLRVRCLGWRPSPGREPEGELWVCTDDILEPFALGRSTDLGQTLDRVWGFEDASPETGCGTCTEVGGTCPAYWPDVIFDLGLRVDSGGVDAPPPADGDAGLPAACIDGALPDMDGGVAVDAGLPSPAPACGCRAGGSPPASLAALVTLALSILRRR